MHPICSAGARQRHLLHRGVRFVAPCTFFDLLTDLFMSCQVALHVPAHRERLLPPTGTVALLLAQTLSEDRCCLYAVDAFVARRLAGGSPASGTQTGAFCRARERLREAMVSLLNHRCYPYALQFDFPEVGAAIHSGDDNNSYLFLAAAGAIRVCLARVRCAFRRLHEASNGFSGIGTCRTRYLVVADSIYGTPASPWTSRQALWIKVF